MKTNQKLINDGNNSTTIEKDLTPDQLISDILLSDEPKKLRHDLREMMDVYLLEEDESKFRYSVYASFMGMDSFLEKLETFAMLSEKIK